MPSDKRKTTPGRNTTIPPTSVASLVQIRGGRLGRIYPLFEELTIGRDDKSSIALELTSVSRRHARVFARGGGYFVADGGSRNGTYVNDREVLGEASLANGDLLKLGDAIFKFLEGGNIEMRYHEEIYRLTILDPLTELHNKRYLLEFLAREISRAARHERPLCAAMMDVDHFKRVNDDYGDLAGDHVLRTLGKIIKPELRQEELVARYGGEEFVFVLPESTLAEAARFAERMRALVEALECEFDKKLIPTTASFGVACLQGECPPETLLSAADRQLYKAKQAGRNCVMTEAEPPA